MKLRTAYLCVNCQEIQDCAPRGCCETCGSETVFPLARALVAEPAKFVSPKKEFAIGHGRRPIAERL